MPSKKEHCPRGDLVDELLCWILRRNFSPGDSLAEVLERLEDVVENVTELIDRYGEDAVVRQILD